MTKTTYWITDNDEGQYLLIKTIEAVGLIGSTVQAFHSLDEAKDAKSLAEDGVAANACGGGNIAGIGVGPQGEPGVPRGCGWPLMRRVRKKRKRKHHD